MMSEVYRGVKATIEAFDRDNGNDCIRIDDMLYFRNGARREVNPYGILHDPPANEYRRLSFVEVYWEELHHRAVDAFMEAKTDFLNTAHANANCGHPAPSLREAKSTLAKLKEKVRLCERKMKLTQQKMQATTEGQQLRQQETETAESHAENEEFMQAVRQIKL
jgi:hypothetical protein